MYSIYALTDPRDQTIRYIGASNNAQRRFQEHIKGHSRCALNLSKERWFASLKQEGLNPILSIIESVTDRQQARERERYWTEQNLHMPLTNARILTGRKAKGTKGTLVFARREILLNQVDLALLSGVPQVVVSRCENGYPIRRQDATAILEALNTRTMERDSTPLLDFSDLDWIIED